MQARTAYVLTDPGTDISHGLGYRGSKCVTDVIDGCGEIWGSIVYGEIVDDWLKVGKRYMPLYLDGTRVILPRDTVAQMVQSEVQHSDCGNMTPKKRSCLKASLFDILGCLTRPSHDKVHSTAFPDAVAVSQADGAGEVQSTEAVRPSRQLNPTEGGVGISRKLHASIKEKRAHVGTDPGTGAYILTDPGTDILHGLAYRGSKCVTDVIDGCGEIWGTVVYGEIVDDWLKVGKRYLPLYLDGTCVILPREIVAQVVQSEVQHSDCGDMTPLKNGTSVRSLDDSWFHGESSWPTHWSMPLCRETVNKGA